MCKPVSDKTETAVAYLAARFWFVGSMISHIALHEVPPQATSAFTDIASCGAYNSLLRGRSKSPCSESKIKDGRVSIAGLLSRFLVDLASASPRTRAFGLSTAAAKAERTDSGELAAALGSIRAM